MSSHAARKLSVMAGPAFSFTAPLFRWEQRPAFRMVTVPRDLADHLHLAGGPPRGFGSIRVDARIGATVWRTPIFPIGDGAFVLPVKRAVRTTERLADGDLVSVDLWPVDGPDA